MGKHTKSKKRKVTDKDTQNEYIHKLKVTDSLVNKQLLNNGKLNRLGYIFKNGLIQKGELKDLYTFSGIARSYAFKFMRFVMSAYTESQKVKQQINTRSKRLEKIKLSKGIDISLLKGFITKELHKDLWNNATDKNINKRITALNRTLQQKRFKDLFKNINDNNPISKKIAISQCIDLLKTTTKRETITNKLYI